MGGGDLNLKKSWHPHTMKNQEKVWKAEQAKSQEEQKLNDLRREIEEEKNREELKRIGQASGVLEKSDNDKKLEWMYKSSTVLINRDEYLLGRTVDKSFELLQEEEKQKEQNLVGVKVPVNHVEHECIPFSIRAYRNLESTEQVDLQRKVLEDPLMLIKQREMESRRKLLENPVKLKELHRILKRDQVLKKRKPKAKKSKKSKKNKKLKKKRKRDSSESSSSETDSNSDTDESDKDLDKELEKRYKKLKGTLSNPEEELSGLSITKLLDAKYETISKELDKAVKSKRSTNRGHSSSQERGVGNRHNNKTTNRGHSSSQERGVGNRHNNNRDRSHNFPRNRRDQHDYRDKRETLQRPSSRERFNSPRNKRDQHLKYLDQRNARRQSRSRQRSFSPRNKRDQQPKYRDERKISRRSRSISRTSKRNHRDDVRSDRLTQQRSHTRSRTRSPAKRSTYAPTSNRKLASSSSIGNQRTAAAKLSNEEKEKRLREMMHNASWRDEERTKTVHKHREEYAREEEQHRARDFDKDFINKEVKKAISNHTSVGSRIRSNLNNIQRTSASMNSNFARK